METLATRPGAGFNIAARPLGVNHISEELR
jgi:hypothetical protein